MYSLYRNKLSHIMDNLYTNMSGSVADTSGYVPKYTLIKEAQIRSSHALKNWN